MTMIDEAGRTALKHYLTSCTVIITSRTPGFKHGTGVAVKYRSKIYILTAAHVLEEELNDENILITGRPDSTFQEADKSALPDLYFSGTHDHIKSSTGTHIPIIKRLTHKGTEDIAALMIQSVEQYLPYTIPHNLSDQSKTDISEGSGVIICGFPGELALHAQHRVTRQIGAIVSTYFAWQTVSKSPKRLDPRVSFVTDFDDQDTCDPQGMSGGGAWAIPKAKDGELWSPHQTQLVGIQSGVDRERNLLGLVSIERVLDLLSNN